MKSLFGRQLRLEAQLAGCGKSARGGFCIADRAGSADLQAAGIDLLNTRRMPRRGDRNAIVAGGQYGSAQAHNAIAAADGNADALRVTLPCQSRAQSLCDAGVVD